MWYSYLTFFIGIVIIVVALFFIRKETNKNVINDEFFNKKQNELLQNIQIAEDIINELNDISDGIIDRLDKKITQVNELLKEVENIEYENKKQLAFEIENLKNNQVETAGSHNAVTGNKKDAFTKDSKEVESNDINRILTLKEKGYDASQIAKKLNKGVGEINLIMNLKKR